MPDLSALSPLPDDTRIWIHAAATPLDDSTQDALLDRLSSFLDEWTSHEQPVKGAATILYDRFVVLAGTRTDGGDISGCGIDEAIHAVDGQAASLDVEWVPSLHVLYRADDETIEAVPRSTFTERASAGTITPETTVFDPSITSLGALRAGEFERPARESWHRRLLALPAGS